VLGLQLEQATIPVVVAARKALGPLLIVVALMLLGVFKLNVSIGHQLSAWLEARAAGKGTLGAYLLGVAFSFAFCPTLFWLFFGLTIPLAITASVSGIVFPAVFAAGTTIPLLLFAALIALGFDSIGQVLMRVRRWDVWVSRVVGFVFLLVGLNETVLYWLL
jgi:cytochrome c biogenesis protein CcdA